MSRLDALISEMCPVGVPYIELQKAFVIRNGYTPSKDNVEYWEGGKIPWFRMEDIRKNGRVLSDSLQYITPSAVKGSLISANSIIIATSATIGEHALITVDFLANQRFTCLTRKEIFIKTLDMKYFFYCCFALDEWCKENTTLGNFSSVDMTKFRKFRFPLPPLPVQQEIVRILDKFSALEAELEAELEARKKQYEYYREQLFEFDDEVPIVAIGDVTQYSTGRTSVSELNADTYVGVDNLLPDKRGKVESMYVPEGGICTRYQEGDILIGNIRPYLKKIWRATNTGGTNGDVLVIHLTSKCIIPEYLYYLLCSDNFFSYNMQHAKGAKMPRGNKDAIMQYKIPIPPLEKQTRIVAILDRFDTLVNDITQGLPAEIAARRKQYEYYRDKLLTFKEKVS